MKKDKAKKATSWLISAAMVGSMCGLEANIVSATSMALEDPGVEQLVTGGVYGISTREGLIKFSQLVNAGKVAENTVEPTEAPTIGNIYQGGGGHHIYLPNP